MSKGLSDKEFMTELQGRRSATGMVMSHPPSGEQKSLDELFGTSGAEESGDRFENLDIDLLVKSPYQVKHTDAADVEALADSLQQSNGVVSPIVVRRTAGGEYEIVAGHTRVDAYKLLGRKTIPSIVKEIPDHLAALALSADNLGHKTMPDFEKYLQVKMLIDKGFVRSNTEAASVLGCSRQDIIRYRSYDELPAEAIAIIDKDRSMIGASAAKELAAVCKEGAEQLVAEGLQRMFDGHLKTQQALMLWVRQKMAGRKTDSNEFNVCNEQGHAFGKVAVTKKGIRISGKGLDMSAIELFLKNELPRFVLRKDGE